MSDLFNLKDYETFLTLCTCDVGSRLTEGFMVSVVDDNAPGSRDALLLSALWQVLNQVIRHPDSLALSPLFGVSNFQW